MKFDDQGREIPDPTPVEVPFAARRPESLQDMIRRLVRTDVSKAAEQVGAETFEEANDFEVGDDDAELSATHHELHEEVVNEAVRVRREISEQEVDSKRTKSRDRSKSGSDELNEEEDVEEGDAAESRTRSAPRKSSTKPRSPERRRPRRREDAEGDEDESE